jgi:hypothetical protein
MCLLWKCSSIALLQIFGEFSKSFQGFRPAGPDILSSLRPNRLWGPSSLLTKWVLYLRTERVWNFISRLSKHLYVKVLMHRDISQFTFTFARWERGIITREIWSCVIFYLQNRYIYRYVTIFLLQKESRFPSLSMYVKQGSTDKNW